MFPTNIELAELLHQHSKATLNIETLLFLCNSWSDTKEAVLYLGEQLTAIEARIAELRLLMIAE
jgi:hypothetical protein